MHRVHAKSKNLFFFILYLKNPLCALWWTSLSLVHISSDSVPTATAQHPQAAENKSGA